MNVDLSAKVPVYVWRVTLIFFLLVLLVLFTAAGDGYCDRIASISISKGDAVNCFEFWLNRYQSLLGGIFALLGAVLAFLAVQSQINQTERLAEIQRVRKDDAVSALAPFALSQISDYASKCIGVIKSAADEVRIGIHHPKIEMPDLPDEATSVLSKYVEYGADEHARDAATILYAIQIQRARFGGLILKTSPSAFGIYTVAELEDALFDALDLYSQASHLFVPVRKRYRDRPFYTEEMYNDMNVVGIDLEDWPRLKFRIKAFAEAYAKSIK